jgi:Arylsulfotransferase (ASST)/Secretion system C-terminal sorting domain
MKKITDYSYIFILFLSVFTFGQNTIGIINNTSNSYNGFTLFTYDTETYLINNCGEVINQWTSNFPPGNSVYLLENGNLLRASKIVNNDIVFGGVGGRAELFDWDGNLIWGYNYSTSQVRQHHEVYPMPNGNVLILAATVMSNADAILAGRDPLNLPQSILYNEQIIEVKPVGSTNANIVWEWNIKDHFIQDFDNSKNNFGAIADNPQLIDINYLGNSAGNSNWLHINSMQYYEQLDQIVISSRLLNEIYIIDHSTTNIESASHTGGTYGKGGDILYRWGNPEAYGQGSSLDKKLFGQHFPHFIPIGLPNAGKLIVFNNGLNRTPSFSEVFILTPPTTALGVYEYITNSAYGPNSPDFIYTDPIINTNFFSHFLSSAQQLPNGNILICSGSTGYLFEIDSNNEKVWEYINPVSTSGVLTQGDNPFETGNILFRAIRYPLNYSAFNGKDLTPNSTIEINPDLSNCTVLNVNEILLTELKIHPNPATNIINIKTIEAVIKIEIYTVLGKLLLKKEKSNSINLTNFSNGLYILKIHFNNSIISKKILKQ